MALCIVVIAIIILIIAIKSSFDIINIVNSTSCMKLFTHAFTEFPVTKMITARDIHMTCYALSESNTIN